MGTRSPYRRYARCSSGHDFAVHCARVSRRTSCTTEMGHELEGWRRRSNLWRPRQDSNLRHRLRRPVLYPLSYEGKFPCHRRERGRARRAVPEL